MVGNDDTQVITKSLNLSGTFLTLVGLFITGLLSFSRSASSSMGSVTLSNGVVSSGFFSYVFRWHGLSFA